MGGSTYQDLLESLADQCDGMSGASLAGVARAAASHALERSVCDFSKRINGGSAQLECLVTQHDFDLAVKDVIASSGDSDWATDDNDDDEEEEKKKGGTAE